MKILFRAIFLLATTLLIGISTSLQARSTPPQDPQSGAGQGAVQDPIGQLHLSPEQQEKIRAIREQNKSERAAINQRLRETNLALQQALDADNPDEALIEQRLREGATAQAASTRMRVLTEVRIRRVLTPEQLITLRLLRQQAADSRRAQRLENQRQNRPLINGPRQFSNQSNGVPPTFPRRANNPRTHP